MHAYLRGRGVGGTSHNDRRVSGRPFDSVFDLSWAAEYFPIYMGQRTSVDLPDISAARSGSASATATELLRLIEAFVVRRDGHGRRDH